MEVTINVVNAFIDGDKGGNPAGVVLEAQRFTREQKQAIAAQAGLPETAFVSPSDSAAFKLEFFTPNRQIPHCGHATIATFSLLRQQGLVSIGRTSKETIDDNRDIYIERDTVFMEQRAPQYTSEGINTAEVLHSLRLTRDDLMPELTPLTVSTGNPFLIVPLRDEAALQRAVPHLDAIEAVSEKLSLVGYYLFSRDTRVAGRHAGARMFAPRYGIAEEAATGTAAGPLACFLHDKLGVRSDGEILIEQGHFIPQPSPSVIRVRLDADSGNIRKLGAGGSASLMDMVAIHI